MPWMPEVHGTLGAALAAQGQVEEGLSHLLAATGLMTSPSAAPDWTPASELRLADWTPAR
jgi:hypothetical protein